MTVLKIALTLEDMALCFHIREEVFVKGQSIAMGDEFDGSDDDKCEHFLLWDDATPVGTVRVRYVEDYAKIERVAVLKAHEGKGYGTTMMEDIVSYLQMEKDIHTFKLSAQVKAIRFYNKLGFEAEGEAYEEAGTCIPHINMTLSKRCSPGLSC